MLYVSHSRARRQSGAKVDHPQSPQTVPITDFGSKLFSVTSEMIPPGRARQGRKPLTRFTQLINMLPLICISEERNMKIGERGQVTIPKDVREKYGLLPNIEVEFVPKESGVLLRKRARRASPVEKVYGILNRKSKTDDIIELLRGR